MNVSFTTLLFNSSAEFCQILRKHIEIVLDQRETDEYFIHAHFCMHIYKYVYTAQNVTCIKPQKMENGLFIFLVHIFILRFHFEYNAISRLCVCNELLEVLGAFSLKVKPQNVHGS